MSELFGNLFYPLAPAALTWWIFQDPWISGIGALWESEFVC